MLTPSQNKCKPSAWELFPFLIKCKNLYRSKVKHSWKPASQNIQACTYNGQREQTPLNKQTIKLAQPASLKEQQKLQRKHSHQVA
jgi:hypothetical protein